jgi:hypothetical protein
VALPAALERVVLAIVRGSPDGATALITSGMLDTVWEIDLRGGDRSRELRRGAVNSVAGAYYLADGRIIVVENHARGRLLRADLVPRAHD